ncbi:molybdenum cofactor guanylyltransferase [Sphingobium boeckii]|uniref:Molybdenum cofactor guanylyltransferase n=1 Tax=Sphingobium boeckii TaxID=1082345 RepID=A0A7W9ALL8_9SPHN|nr:molybdenum cofactor guanylyltransferase [Sphingobium boeckii]MBB5687793.1 molybdopterin-guanine dinucleotide biosynthesis protein A [Sphingobium boeckii]
MILGAIIAGGQSRRFGSDKALASVDGKPLLDHVAEALAAQTDAIIVVGRSWPGITSIADRPTLDQGPLGGLCAALHHAQAHGFETVLTVGCDILPLPAHLPALLAPGSAVVKGQQLIGLWRADLASALEDYLESQPDRAIRGWMATAAVRTVTLDASFHNLNTPEDLAAFTKDQAA